MKITRRQLSRLIAESIDNNENENFRAKIIDMIQTGNIEDYNQAVDLNDMLGLLDPIELGKQFWQLKIKSKRSFKIRNAKGYLTDELFEHFNDVKDDVFHNYAGVIQVGQALQGTRDQMFAMLIQYLNHDLIKEGFIEKEQSVKEYPGLLALFKDGFDAMIEMFMSDHSPYPYVIVKIAPSGGDKNLDILEIHETYIKRT